MVRHTRSTCFHNTFQNAPISNLQDSILKHAAGICKELGPSIAAATQISSEACGSPGKSPKADRGETQHCLATADQQDPLLTRPHWDRRWLDPDEEVTEAGTCSIRKGTKRALSKGTSAFKTPAASHFWNPKLELSGGSWMLKAVVDPWGMLKDCRLLVALFSLARSLIWNTGWAFKLPDLQFSIHSCQVKKVVLTSGVDLFQKSSGSLGRWQKPSLMWPCLLLS